MHIDIHNKIGECMYLDKMNNTNPTENMSEIRCSGGTVLAVFSLLKNAMISHERH